MLPFDLTTWVLLGSCAALSAAFALAFGLLLAPGLGLGGAGQVVTAVLAMFLEQGLDVGVKAG